MTLKSRLVGPLQSAALASGASTWLAHRHPRRRIVMLHGIGNGDLSVPAFEAALKWLGKRFRFTHLHEMVRGIAEGRPAHPRGEIALTFDDGLRNHLEAAYPLLRRYEAPATFFVCPGLIEGRRWLWNHEARSRLQSMSAKARAANGFADVEALIGRMKAMPMAERVANEERLRALTPGFTPSAEQRRRFDPLSWSDIERLDSSLVTIGSHTMSHPILPTLDDAALMSELQQSRHVLERRLDRTVDLFCYPNGSTDERVRAAVSRNYRAAVTTEYGFVEPGADRHRLARIAVTPRLPLLAWRMHRPNA